MNFGSIKVQKRGKVIVDDLLNGEISDFNKYTYLTLTKYQALLSRAKSIGLCVARYVISIDDVHLKTEIVDKIFSTKNYDFITIFRVAKDLATKFDKYDNNRVRRLSYLRQHTEITENIFDLAYELAKYSTLSKKSHLIDETISYAEIQSEFITA